MWRQLFDTLRGFLFLVHDVRENRRDIEELGKSLAETREVVRELSHAIQRISEREQHEREKLMLRMEKCPSQTGTPTSAHERVQEDGVVPKAQRLIG